MNVNLIESGQRIKSIRKKHSYTMLGFATLLGISSASTINNWEKGNNLPKSERLEKIAILGNTTVEWIKYGDFKEYVLRLLYMVNQEEQLNPKELTLLLKMIDEQKLTYQNDLKILKCAQKIYPNFFKNVYKDTLSKKNILLFEELLDYTIEQDNHYRKMILPTIQKPLTNSKTVNKFKK